MTSRLDLALFLTLLFFSVIARNNTILKKLVLEAKREYEKDAEHRVHIFMADSYVSHAEKNTVPHLHFFSSFDCPADPVGSYRKQVRQLAVERIESES